MKFSAVATTLLAAASVAHAAPSKIFVIVFGGFDASTVQADPYFAQLATSGMYLSNFHQIAHPEQPNYIAAIAGDTFGVTGNGLVDLSSNNITHIGNLVTAKNLTWKAYLQDLPNSTFAGLDYTPTYRNDSNPVYKRWHNPFISVIGTNGTDINNVVNAAQLDADLTANALPNFSFYVPNYQLDGYNGSLASTSSWAQGFLGPKLNSTGFADTLVVVTFDQANTTTNGTNQVYTVLTGPGLPAGLAGKTDNSYFNTYSLLSSAEAALGLASLGKGDAIASAFALNASAINATNGATSFPGANATYGGNSTAGVNGGEGAGVSTGAGLGGAAPTGASNPGPGVSGSNSSTGGGSSGSGGSSGASTFGVPVAAAALAVIAGNLMTFF